MKTTKSVIIKDKDGNEIDLYALIKEVISNVSKCYSPENPPEAKQLRVEPVWARGVDVNNGNKRIYMMMGIAFYQESTWLFNLGMAPTTNDDSRLLGNKAHPEIRADGFWIRVPTPEGICSCQLIHKTDNNGKVYLAIDPSSATVFTEEQYAAVRGKDCYKGTNLEVKTLK